MDARPHISRIAPLQGEQAAFLSAVSHELKTPISIVQAEAEVLAMKRQHQHQSRNPAECVRFAQSAADEMRRLGGIIESVLLLARLDQGERRLERNRQHTSDIVLAAFERNAALAEEHGVELHLSLCDDENGRGPVVLGSADLLQAGVGGLVRDAIRSTPRGGWVELASSASGASGADAVIAVRGPQQRTTGRISQAGPGRGVGLDLQIAAAIAELHGGRVEAEIRVSDTVAAARELRCVLPLAP
ncbi:MAG: HAMP domain-containing sensor histidine kinase [Planctomycetota bacterium]